MAFRRGLPGSTSQKSDRLGGDRRHVGAAAAVGFGLLVYGLYAWSQAEKAVERQL